MKNFVSTVLLSTMVFALVGCSSIPKGAKAVTDFELDKYLGSWYEIARLDFVFEKDLNNTTANYSVEKEGIVTVLNRGFNPLKNQWKEAKGKAKFRGSPTVGELAVSFFGPFYSGYNILSLDENYTYALIAGKDTKYLWFLSRKNTMSEEVKQKYIQIAKQLGYDTDQLVWVEHTH